MTNLNVPPGDALIPASLAAKMIAQAEHRCWAEGYDAGHDDQQAVTSWEEYNDHEDYPEPTPNPYRADDRVYYYKPLEGE